MKKQMIIEDQETSIKSFIIIFTIILGVLFIAYLFTEFAVTSKKTNPTPVVKENYINANQTFRMVDKEYYVLFIDMSSYLNKKVYDDILIKYEQIPVYIVDLSKGLNKAVIGDEINYEPESYSQLSLEDPTLIKIEDKKVTDYVEGLPNISSILK